MTSGVHRVEFAELCKNCAIIARRTCYEEKLLAAANILGNALLRDSDGDKLSDAELDHFTRCVEHLSLGAIRVLGKVLDRAALGRKPPISDEQNERFDFSRLRSDLDGYDPDLLMGLLGELNSFGLVHLADLPGGGAGPEGERKYYNYPIESTPLGYRIKRYVLDPGAGAS